MMHLVSLTLWKFVHSPAIEGLQRAVVGVKWIEIGIHIRADNAHLANKKYDLFQGLILIEVLVYARRLHP